MHRPSDQDWPGQGQCLCMILVARRQWSASQQRRGTARALAPAQGAAQPCERRPSTQTFSFTTSKGTSPRIWSLRDNDGVARCGCVARGAWEPSALF